MAQLRRAKISALGIYVPPRLLTNADLEKLVDPTAYLGLSGEMVDRCNVAGSVCLNKMYIASKESVCEFLQFPSQQIGTPLLVL